VPADERHGDIARIIVPRDVNCDVLRIPRCRGSETARPAAARTDRRPFPPAAARRPVSSISAVGERVLRGSKCTQLPMPLQRHRQRAVRRARRAVLVLEDLRDAIVEDARRIDGVLIRRGKRRLDASSRSSG
jgi:hypothetical protein